MLFQIPFYNVTENTKYFYYNTYYNIHLNCILSENICIKIHIFCIYVEVYIYCYCILLNTYKYYLNEIKVLENLECSDFSVSLLEMCPKGQRAV